MIRLPRSYANLAEVMMYENQLLADAGWGPAAMPHRAVDIEGAWDVWVLEDSLVMDGIVVPRMFMTDFASIPKLLRWLYDPVGEPYQVAAVVHDFLYSSARYVTRGEADIAYYRISRAMGTPLLTAVIQYVALRIGGWMAFRSNRKRLAAEGPVWRMLEPLDPTEWVRGRS